MNSKLFTKTAESISNKNKIMNTNLILDLIFKKNHNDISVEIES